MSRLDEYNRQHTEDYGFRTLNVFLRDARGNISGGLIGGTFWGWLHVDYLWVDERLRGEGWGRAILEAAEKEAALRDCHGSHLETHSFQALEFYQKLGYSVYGQLPNFPKGHVKYFLSKKLSG